MSLQKLAPFRHHTGCARHLPPSAPSRAAWPAGRWAPAPRTPRASHWGSCCPGWAPFRSSSPRSPHAATCCLCHERLGVFRGRKDKIMDWSWSDTRGGRSLTEVTTPWWRRPKTPRGSASLRSLDAHSPSRLLLIGWELARARDAF